MQENTITLPSQAAKIVLALAERRNAAQMRLDDVISMARAVLGVAADWQLQSDDAGQVFFAAPPSAGAIAHGDKAT